MAYVVLARLRARPGKTERLAEVLREVTGPSRDEPGNLVYQAQQCLEDPRLFVVYEQYVDEAAYHAHTDSPHYGRLIRDEAAPRLIQDRKITHLETL